MDWLSFLGGGSTIPGASPDQTAQFNQLQNQASARAVLPALFALGIGALSHPRRYGKGGAILAGLRDAGEAYQNSEANNLNSSLAMSRLAGEQNRQAVLDQMAARHQNDYDINTGLHAQDVANRTAKDAPLGYDGFAPLRTKYPELNSLLPSAQETATMPRSRFEQMRTSFVGSSLKSITDPSTSHHFEGFDNGDGTKTVYDIRTDKKGDVLSPVPVMSGGTAGSGNIKADVKFTDNPDGTRTAFLLRTDKEGKLVGNPTPIKALSGGLAKAPADRLANVQRLSSAYANYKIGLLGSGETPMSMADYAKSVGYDVMGSPLPATAAVAAPATSPTSAPTAPSTPSTPTSKPANAPTTPSLPSTITTTSAAIDYLMKNYGMDRDAAIQWIRANHS